MQCTIDFVQCAVKLYIDGYGYGCGFGYGDIKWRDFEILGMSTVSILSMYSIGYVYGYVI